MKKTISGLCFVSLAVTVGALSGCGSSNTITPPAPPAPEVNNCKTTNTTSPSTPTPTANYAGTPFSGTVLAGTTPLIGATVQIYAAGTAGNGSAGTALLTTALTSGANGGFTVPAYTCPLSNSVVYAVATGGSLTPTGAANTATELAAAIGTCNSVSSANVVINEATTVATVFAMQQFIGASGLGTGNKLGATATNASGISLAAATALNLVSTATGQAPGASFPSTGTAPVRRINTLANLLNTCVAGGASSASCTQLTSATTRSGVTPSNTLDAMVNVARQPGTNVLALYNQGETISVYSPGVIDLPADWMLPVIFGGGAMNSPSAISIDSTGTVWVANYFSNASAFTNTGVPVFANGITDGNINSAYGGAVNVNDEFWVTNEESHGFDSGFGSVSVFNKSGGATTFGGGGQYFPIAAAFDTSGVGWIVDYGDSGMSLFSLAKTSVAGTSGYSSSHLAFPVAVATDADCNAYVANQGTSTITRVAADGASYADFTVGSGPSGLAIDTAGNVWSANYYGNNVGLVTGGTTVASGSAGFTGGGINHPQGIAADGAGTVWVANFRAPGFTELAGAGTSTPGAGLSPATGWGPDSGNTTAFALAIDASGNVWMSNFNANVLLEFVGIAVPVKTPLLGPVRVP